MERGPIALFGAIIAVGLGPAMWLGAQFGNVTDVPSSPPAVRSEHNSQNQDRGGGAGSAPEDPTVVLETKPRGNSNGLDDGPRAQPSASATSTATGKPGPKGAATRTPTDNTSTPATEPTDSPPGSGNGGGDGSGDGTVQPSPPTDSGPGSGDDSQQPAV